MCADTRAKTAKSFSGRMPLLQERDVFIVVSELGRIERSDREAFEAWDCETKAMLLRLRNREQKKWPTKARNTVKSDSRTSFLSRK